MSIRSEIQSLLDNSSSVTSLVSSYVESTTTKYMIFYGNLLPGKITIDTGTRILDIDDTTINFFRVSPITGGSSFTEHTWQVSCRANDQYDSEQLQDAVWDTLNRQKFDTGFIIADKLANIQPEDDNDNYNAAVSLTVKAVAY